MDKLYQLLLGRDQSPSDLRLKIDAKYKVQFEFFMKLINSYKFHVNFSKLTTDPERVQFVLTKSTVCKFISILVKQFKSVQNDTKDNVKAANFITEGREAFENGNFCVALEKYSSAICFASHADNHLSLAYESRATIFLRLEQYESALKDIDAVFKLVDNPKYLLYIRKWICLVELGRVSQTNQLIEELRTHYDLPSLKQTYTTTLMELHESQSGREIEQQNYEKIDSELLKSVSSVIEMLSKKNRFQPKTEFPSLSAKVNVKYDEMNGHHLVTTEDIQFGDILAVTKPYATVMTEMQDCRFCHHCLAALQFTDRFIRSVPCDHCSRVMYCSEKCRSDSWKSYHHIECPLLPLSTEGYYLDQYLAFRTFLISGGLEPNRDVVAKYEEKPGQKDQEISSMEFTGNLDDYENVYQLTKTTKADRHPIYHHKDIEDIIVLAFLAKLAQIDTKESVTDNDILATKIMFRHLAQIRANGWFVFKSDTQSINNSPSMEYFTVIDPLISLLNSSCRPNTSIITVDSDLINDDTNPNRFGSNVLLFFVHQPIKAGSVLSAMLPWSRSPEAWCPCHECGRERVDNPYDYKAFYSVACRSFKTSNVCLGQMRLMPPSRLTITGNQYECTTCPKGVTKKEFKKIYKEMEKAEVKVGGLLGDIENAVKDDAETKDKMDSIKTILDGDMSTLFLPYNGTQLAKYYNRLSHLSLRAGFKQDQLKFDFVQLAWNCVEKSSTALKTQFGGDSEELLRMLRDSVNSFRQVVDWLSSYLAKMNRADKATQDKRQLIQDFKETKESVQTMQDLYKLV